MIGEAQDGREAIQQAQSLHPDVILMDLEMPVMDGYKATRLFKQTTPAIWIIALTIHGDLISRQKAIHAGADAFVEKGAPLEELIQKIQQCRRNP